MFEKILDFLCEFSSGDVIAIITVIVSLIVNKHTITADVASKARIQWIQDIRKATVDLLSAYYAILSESDNDKVKELYTDTRNTQELLMLYFGPDKPGTKKATDMYDAKTNKGKNDLIITHINKISEMMYQYVKAPAENTDCDVSRVCLKEDIESALHELSEAIRIYGKIEWDKAKGGR